LLDRRKMVVCRSRQRGGRLITLIHSNKGSISTNGKKSLLPRLRRDGVSRLRVRLQAFHLLFQAFLSEYYGSCSSLREIEHFSGSRIDEFVELINYFCGCLDLENRFAIVGENQHSTIAWPRTHFSPSTNNNVTTTASTYSSYFRRG
jgi:hypothetical protein